MATLGILSIGEMGLGVAKLLVAHNYRVITNTVGRRLVTSCILDLDGYLSVIIVKAQSTEPETRPSRLLKQTKT